MQQFMWLAFGVAALLVALALAAVLFRLRGTLGAVEELRAHGDAARLFETDDPGDAASLDAEIGRASCRERVCSTV